jgi:N-methylhydantoinase B
MHCTPWGLEGGRDGFGNQVSLHLNEGAKTDFPNAKIMMQRLRPGEGFSACSGGGGGFGAPIERDPARVLLDVIEGYIGLDEAHDVYGVVILDGRVDEARTEALRKQKSRLRIAEASPD